MPIVPLQKTTVETGRIRLARYAEIIGYDERRFWGIAVGTPSTCRDIWTLAQRLKIARYLAEAQIEIEKIVGFPVGKRWIAEVNRTARCKATGMWCYAITGGVRAVSDISIGEAVDHTSDPAVIGPIAYAYTDPWEVHVYHPGTDIEIDPDTVEIVTGQLTITIPRARMVTVALADNPAAGLAYNVISNFEATVDVKRVYNDPSTHAKLTTNHKCSLACSSTGCNKFVKDACITVGREDISELEIYQASYLGGAWARASSNCCEHSKWMQLNYLAGLEPDFQMEDAIVRLAHAKMPTEPCGCDPAKSLWTRDRNVPAVVTAERINCPFGLSDGAWAAFKFALDMAVVRGSVL